MFKKFSIILVLFLLLDAERVRAEEQEDLGGDFSLTYENDIFRNTDKSYTNGVRFSWVTQENDLPKIIKNLTNELLTPTSEQIPFFPRDGKKRFSYAFGQSMFTPEDVSSKSLQTNDRPYAGWLYGSIGLISDTGKHLDNLELTIGVVGPLSLAEQTQDFVHKNITGSPIAQGWDDHQIGNEPGIILAYEHKWRNLYEAQPFGLAADFTPHAGFSLGNIFTHIATGGTVRLGYDLPSDHGPPRVRPSISGTDYFKPSNQLSTYLFAGSEARLVGRNIFLDGNSFGDSHSVDKEYLIWDMQFGAAISYKNTRLSYTHVVRSKEYKSQDSGDRFGALTLTIKF